MTFQLVPRHNPTRLNRVSFTLQPVESTISGLLHEAMGSPTHVQVMFDPDNQLLGLLSCTADAPESYALRPLGSNRKDGTLSPGRKVSTSGLVNRFDLEKVTRRVYLDVHLSTDDPGVWVVNLNGESVAAAGRRPGTTATSPPAVATPTVAPAVVASAPVAHVRESPPKTTTAASTHASTGELRLRCNSCDETFEPNDGQNFHRHLLRQHDRRAEADERTPRPAA